MLHFEELLAREHIGLTTLLHLKVLFFKVWDGVLSLCELGLRASMSFPT